MYNINNYKTSYLESRAIASAFRLAIGLELAARRKSFFFELSLLFLLEQCDLQVQKHQDVTYARIMNDNINRVGRGKIKEGNKKGELSRNKKIQCPARIVQPQLQPR